jgi:hypothetical protein
MAAFQRFDSFVAAMGNGQAIPGADVLKLAFTNVQPVVSQTLFNQIVEIAAGGGSYPAGGYVLSVASSAQIGGLWTFIPNPLQVVAIITPMATWRWAVIYDSTTGGLIGFADYGGALTLAGGELVNITFDPINGLIQGVS